MRTGLVEDELGLAERRDAKGMGITCAASVSLACGAAWHGVAQAVGGWWARQRLRACGARGRGERAGLSEAADPANAVMTRRQTQWAGRGGAARGGRRPASASVGAARGQHEVR